MNRTTTIIIDGPGAIYMRVSTDAQDAERQHTSTGGWLARHKVSPGDATKYEDIGWSRASAAKRPKFQSMLQAVRDGQIRWIVVDRPDRFGCKDKFEAFHYLHMLREAGCRLFTVDDQELTAGDTGSSVITLIDYDQSERELREKSLRTLTGKVEFAKRCEWLGGRIPYGMDVVAFHLGDGDVFVEQWRVSIIKRDFKVKVSPDGQRREYRGTRNFPASEKDEILQLRPSVDESKLRIIRWVHETFLSQAITPGTLARQLAELGTELPPYADQWERHHVTEILTNPVYMGRPAWNRKSVGDYNEWTGGQRVEKQPGSRKRHHPRSDWVLPDQPLFEPVVSSETWENSQVKLAKIAKGPRSSKPQYYIYSDLVYCGTCNEKMHGQNMRTGRRQTRSVATYLCGTYNGWRSPHDKNKPCTCQARRVRQETLDEVLKSFLSDTLPHVDDLSSAWRSEKPAALVEAIKRAVDAHKAMRERVGAHFVKVPTTDGKEMTVLEVPTGDVDCSIHVPKWSTEELERLYRWQFESDEPEFESKKDDLLADQEELIETLKKIPSSAVSALTKVQNQLSAIEGELAKIDDGMVNAADRFKEAKEEWDQLQIKWEAAAKALDSDGAARRKSEAIKSVIEKIVVYFRPTGKRKPAFEVDTIQVIPKTPPDWRGQGTLPRSTRSCSMSSATDFS
jgi:DNA invertase Pin-like site-specific DNA recombinase